jgi:hypothetical protein
MRTVLASIIFIAHAAQASDDGRDPTGIILRIVAVTLTVAAFGWFFARRARKSREAATGGRADGFAFIIAPAPPLADKVAELRSLVGETSPAPRITRYSRLAVAADERGLTINDAKAGPLVTVPVSDIVSIEARPATLKPAGTLIATTFPAVWLEARRGDAQVSVALAPIVGAYNKVSPAEAQTIAMEITTRLGLPT